MSLDKIHDVYLANLKLSKALRVEDKVTSDILRSRLTDLRLRYGQMGLGWKPWQKLDLMPKSERPWLTSLWPDSVTGSKIWSNPEVWLIVFLPSPACI